MAGLGVVLCKLVHQEFAGTVLIVVRVVMATPIMAQLVPDDEDLLVPNDGDSPARKTTQSGVVNDAPLLGRIDETCGKFKKSLSPLLPPPPPLTHSLPLSL